MTDPLDFLRQAAVEATPAVAVAPRRRIDATRPDHPMAWADAAACAGMDTGLFFAEGIVDPDVKATCTRCAVLAECRDWGVRHEEHGYWGGLSERGRRKLRRTLGIHLTDSEDPGDTAA